MDQKMNNGDTILQGVTVPLRYKKESMAMPYNPEVSAKEIEKNHTYFSERVSLYQKKGLDFIKSREYILAMAHSLQGSILEIGTGTGYTSLAVAKAGYMFASIDNDREALQRAASILARARVLSHVTLYKMDGTSMDFGHGSFENIICVNLFHHVDKAHKMFSEIDRVVCAHGKVVFADFNKRGMEIVHAVHEKEGRVHKNSGVTKEKVYSYYHGLGYEIKEYKDECHWILIGRKRIQQ
jgi:ubiquinone/menaquinone biosynthesis C-methylase UbiE